LVDRFLAVEGEVNEDEIRANLIGTIVGFLPTTPLTAGKMLEVCASGRRSGRPQWTPHSGTTGTGSRRSFSRRDA
jgi:hypothetical protein